MVKMKYWRVQIHVLTDFNHNLNLIHYLSHNYQICLGNLKVKAWTGHWNGSNGISNKTVSDRLLYLLCYLLNYRILFSVLHHIVSVFISFIFTLQITQRWNITWINHLPMYQIQYIPKTKHFHCQKKKLHHHSICLNLWIKTQFLTWTSPLIFLIS